MFFKFWRNADIREIMNHDYDYPYSKGHEYPDYIYDQRAHVARDTYAVYVRNRMTDDAKGYADRYYREDKRVYDIVVKIGRGHDITDAELRPVAHLINKRFKDSEGFGYATMLRSAVNSFNLQAIDMLFKYGADPYMYYDDSDPEDEMNFIEDVRITLHPGFSVDAIRLYVKNGYDPNYIIDEQNQTTFLAEIVSLQWELGWVAMMECGGNPWVRVRSAGDVMSVAADAVLGRELPFVDYMIAKPALYLDAAEPEWIYELLNSLTGYTPRNDLETKCRQRMIGTILEYTHLQPSAKILDYINYRPEPQEPEGYGSSPKFD